MASMYRRSKTWYIQFFEDGKRRRRSLETTSIQRARKKVTEIEVALAEGRPITHKKDMPVDEFTKKYLVCIKRDKRPYSVKSLTHRWKQFVAWAKPVKLGDVTSEHVRAYRDHLLNTGKAKSTVRSILLCLSSIFRTAIKDMHCLEGENPVKGVGLPKADEGFPRYLELDEIDRLLECAKRHSADMHLLIALGVYAGLRKNELINALWTWTDFTGSGRIFVQSNGTFKTKSGRDRKVPMNAKLRTILEGYEKGDGFILYPEQEEREGSETTYRVDITRAFGKVSREAGLEWVTPHKLRHTFASQLAIAGVSLYKIGAWLGHRDVQTTQIYAHLSPEDEDINRF
jgi:integrase